MSIFLIVINSFAKSSPITQSARLLAFARAKSLNNGISISWLEQTWNEDSLAKNAPTKADFILLKKLGFKSIRLPVAFTSFSSKITQAQLFTYIDNVIKLCDTYGFKLVIDYHYGQLSDNNYLTETPQIINLWLKLTKRYKNASRDNLFFEIYNEPPHINPKVWKDAAYNIVTAIRKVDKQRTLIVGASNYNSIYELSRFERLADDNIIYTFHYYEPFFFTHQGAAWVGDQVATTGVSFPYNAENFPILNPKAKNTPGESNYRMYPRDGNEQSINDKLQIVKNWALKYDVPIICGEYGVYNKYADLDSRCRYIKAVRKALKRLDIPGMLWDYNGTFSLFNGKPTMQTLSSCMRDAISNKP
ncbi:cellulase family glycosylhydrolase [Mucilaginibacter sp. CAU 1740]|uniref:glycoside hydrolase family 5 protein n=1 Tax=Mucilaginibacter sp. CAU 1740 TaxID=3140365 RepID=UPI00325A93E1